ncbi:hypothetical protein HZ326_28937 [Fusarium oxysporum f. sp. albedinis]|nr:hypothetical protein HZ326_28937 [Fusarium oxysporum f. sp. albedinis]
MKILLPRPQHSGKRNLITSNPATIPPPQRMISLASSTLMQQISLRISHGYLHSFYPGRVIGAGEDVFWGKKNMFMG